MPNAAQIVNELLPNLWVFIAHTLATISLLIILSRFVYEPFKKSMRDRRQGIKDILINANAKEDLAEKKSNENIKILENTKNKVKNIIEEAKIEAEKNKSKIINDALTESHDLMHNAKKSIVTENNKNTEKVKELISKNSVLIASKILETKLKDSDHKKIIDSFINDLDLNGDYDEE